MPGVCLLLLWIACGGGAEVYQVRGVVESVDPDHLQLHVAHEEIPGFMPAMSMNFDVLGPQVLRDLAPGDEIQFALQRTEASLRIVSVTRTGNRREVPSRSVDVAARSDVAPTFELMDQDGRRFASEALRGHAVVLDFIFTRCAGPCPILTARHRALQQGLSPELRACTRFVSISVDPEFDRPQVLRQYALARNVDLSQWTFLTGSAAQVEGVLRSFGVGATWTGPRDLAHTVATLLIDREGRIAERYLGLATPREQMAQDLAAACG